LNKLKGTITAVTNKDEFSKVSLSVENQILTAIIVNENTINPNLSIGQSVTMLFKETDVTLSLTAPKQISIDNQLPVRVETIKKGMLLSKVVVALQQTYINTVVPAEFAARLEEGMEVILLIRSNELMLME